MSRHLLTAALLVLAATTAHAITPSREDANGASGSCPQAQPLEVAVETGVADDAAAPVAPAAPAATPVPAKTGAAVRPKTGARWHSFLPGMFK